MWHIINGNNVDVLRQYPDNTFDSIVTDPPYGIAFLGKDWDSRKASETTSKIAGLHNLPSGMAHTSLADDLEFQFWMRDVFAECLRVLKPGGHLLAFSAARTYHHMAMAAQTAGFEIRDQLMWIYSSGFPKSQDVGRSIQRSIGVEEYEEIIDTTKNSGFGMTDHARVRAGVEWSTTKSQVGKVKVTDPEAKVWEGWGTALKPAHEPIVMARKPLDKDCSIPRNCQRWGVGALNIDACRVPYENEQDLETYLNNVAGPMERSTAESGDRIGMHEGKTGFRAQRGQVKRPSAGRRTATFGSSPSHGGTATPGGESEQGWTHNEAGRFPSNVMGEIADYQRYFYCPKVSKSERGEGNNHPTVKPIELMKYLIRLVTPPGGHVLDPFNGSGSTGCAAVELGMNYTGIELDENYVAIAQRRIEAREQAHKSGTTFEDLFE